MINITSQDYHLKKCSILGIEVKKKLKTKAPLRIGNLIQNSITPLEFIAIRKRKGPHLKAMLRCETNFSYKINNQHLTTQSWTSYKSPHFERMKIHYCLLNLYA
jgi:hypothetical protein